MSRSAFLRFCSSFRFNSSSEPFFTTDRRDSICFCCSPILRLMLSSSSLSSSSWSFFSLATIICLIASLEFSVRVLSVASLAFSLLISPLYWFSRRAFLFSTHSPSRSSIAFSASATSLASSCAALALARSSFVVFVVFLPSPLPFPSPFASGVVPLPSVVSVGVLTEAFAFGFAFVFTGVGSSAIGLMCATAP